MSIDIADAAKFIERASEKIRVASKRGMASYAQETIQKLHDLSSHHYITGQFYQSWKIVPCAGGIDISTSCPYAKYLEARFGILREATQNCAGQAVAHVQKNLRDLL